MDAQIYDQTTAFAFDLLSQLYVPDQNLVFSPCSLLSVLTMAALGASGSSRQQMIRALFNPGATISDSVDSYVNAVTPAAALHLDVANLLYSASGFSLKSDFVASLRDKFNAQAKELDFSHQDSLDTINSDVNKATHGMIPAFLSYISPETTLILVNALHFQDSWRERFDAHHDDDFSLQSGGRVQTRFLTKKSGFSYFVDSLNDVKAIELPYRSEGVSMVAILPSADVTVRNFLQAQLRPAYFQHILAHFSWMREVTVELPSFEISSQHSLIAPLRALGIRDIFDPFKANFSRLSPNSNELYVSDVIQKAVIRVDANGTEAAAASGIAMPVSAANDRAYEFVADRPFVYVLLQKVTRSSPTDDDVGQQRQILAVGVIENPSKNK